MKINYDADANLDEIGIKRSQSSDTAARATPMRSI